jgi:hypothetical protein
MDNIKVDLRKIGWSGVDWICLAQIRDKWEALVNMVMGLRVQKKKFGENLEQRHNWQLLKKCSVPITIQHYVCLLLMLISS